MIAYNQKSLLHLSRDSKTDSPLHYLICLFIMLHHKNIKHYNIRGSMILSQKYDLLQDKDNLELPARNMEIIRPFDTSTANY